jgi:hypothetical protein
MVYLGACLIAGIRLARQTSVNVRVIPTSNAINESVDLSGNYLQTDYIFLRMSERKVTKVDRTAEGLFVTFTDGNTFFFPSDLLYKVCLKDGQLVGQPDKPVG